MVQQNTTKQKRKLHCSKCGYTFYPRGSKEEVPFRCPYCGKEGTLSEVKHVLEEI